ncbi:MAG: SAM-dependent methyltransferase, partial [Candidatus Omnitrophica bacterium]|nr:SAM-dependent methyltransferase [Candidatus Omnitrophota bacterium]
LKPSGVMQFEDPYWGAVIDKTAYDQFYDEHVFLFSAASLSRAFRRHGLELVDVEPQPTHGGSMRYTVAHAGSRAPSEAVRLLLAEEDAKGLLTPQTAEAFRRRCEASRECLRALLDDLRARGKRVAGYAATSKSTTVTNYCRITPDLVEYISDTTPLKHGTFSPGAHIPVVPDEVFQTNPPDAALLFAWNHAEEIMEKEKRFEEKGGQWILPLSTGSYSKSC